jgi:hypothetical protein
MTISGQFLTNGKNNGGLFAPNGSDFALLGELLGICFLRGALEGALEGIGEGRKGGCIPPGPNSPVGIIWNGLSKRGIGMHGATICLGP